MTGDLLTAFGHKSKSRLGLFLPVTSNKAVGKVLLPESISPKARQNNQMRVIIHFRQARYAVNEST